MKLKPLHDLLIVKHLVETNRAGLFLPEESQMSLRVKRGLVIAASDGARNEQGNMVSLMVKPGDEILFTGDGIEIEEDKQKYLILREGEVFCKIGQGGSES